MNNFILILVLLFSLTGISANAEEGGNGKWKQKWQERYENASPEKKAKMEQKRAAFKKMSPEQRKETRAKLKALRQEFKQKRSAILGL